jgi:hypothetical protein
MVTKHFMEKMMVSAGESCKITKQIERCRDYTSGAMSASTAINASSAGNAL